MQEKKNKNFNSLGIFQKLFNFFTDNLLARGVKRTTLGQHDSLSPAKPNGEMITVHFQDHENSKDDLGSEIQVQFKQFEGPVDKFGDQFQMHKAADRIPDQVRSSRDKAMEKGKNIPSDLNLALAIQDEEVKRTPRRSSPLLGLGSNIDEKSDEFIKRRKEAMSRNLSMDTKPS